MRFESEKKWSGWLMGQIARPHRTGRRAESAGTCGNAPSFGSDRSSRSRLFAVIMVTCVFGTLFPPRPAIAQDQSEDPPIRETVNPADSATEGSAAVFEGEIEVK